MVQVSVNGVRHGDASTGRDQGLAAKVKQAGKMLLQPSDSANITTNNTAANNNGIGENGTSHSNSSSVNKTAVEDGKGGDNGGGGGGGRSRKLTKNEKRRQKNKLKKAEANAGSEVMESMKAANGVAVASWPPPPSKEEQGDAAADTVQVCSNVTSLAVELSFCCLGGLFGPSLCVGVVVSFGDEAMHSRAGVF